MSLSLSATPTSTTTLLPDKRRYLQVLNETVLLNPWIPETHRNPHPKQSVFLTYEGSEALYGGAAGGGKSAALLMGALQYVHVPGYNALILRRTFKQLEKPGALIELSKEWLMGKAGWNEQKKRWLFPSGATLSFGHMEYLNAMYDYQGAAYHFVGFDELTQFLEPTYKYLFSRSRRLEDFPAPIRVRCTANPGGIGHEWVRQRFIPDEFVRLPEDERFNSAWSKGGRMFFPARLEDNPSLDREQYEEQLAELDAVERAQLRKGDWTAHASGRFNRKWWKRYRHGGDHLVLLDTNEIIPMGEIGRVSLTDPANRKTKSSKYTAMGMFGDLGKQRVAVLDVVREKLRLEEIIPKLNGLCRDWRPVEWAGIEANGFQIALVNQARERRWEYIPTVMEMEPRGKSKLTRATAGMLRAEQGLIYLPEDNAEPWVEPFITELARFTGNEKEDTYTDQVDIFAYAIIGLDLYGAYGDAAPFLLGK